MTPLTSAHPNLGHSNDQNVNRPLKPAYIALPLATAVPYHTPVARYGGPSPSSLRRKSSLRPVTTSTADSDVLYRDRDLSFYSVLLRSAILDFENIIKSNHEESKQVICNLGEEMCTELNTVSTVMQLLSEAVCLHKKKKRKTNSDLDVLLMTAADWIKV